MDEEMIVVEAIEDKNVVDTEIIEQKIEQNETVEYIEVGELEEVEIEIDETVGYTGAGDGNYAPLDHTHPINQIENLDDTLHTLASPKEYHSTNSGFAEFRQWNPNGYYKSNQNLMATGGVGYFVSLTKGTGSIYGDVYIDICQKKNNDGSISVEDIYGVTVSESGFYGYQSADYDSLDSKSIDKSDNPNYAKVCLLGNVKVRVTDEMLDKIKIGDFVVPNEDGYAKKADNNVGFKVISKGIIEKGWNYVSIALVPQNDNISRIMKELEGTKGSLSNVTLELDKMGNKVDDIFNTSINVSNKVDGLGNILNETIPKVEEQVNISKETSEKAQEAIKEAKETMNAVASQYSEALNKAKDAHDILHGVDGNGGVLDDIEDLKEDMQPLAQWKGQDGSEGVAAFVAQANEDRTQLATLTSAFGPNGSDITAIIQKIDENGAAIQHLVSHVDKYIIGAYSPAYGLSIDETTIIQPGAIYVPTKGHVEDYSVENAHPISINFEENKSYIWQRDDVGEYIWAEYKPVSTETTYFNGINEGDLWYCWQGIYNENGDKLLYDSGTLYCWDNTKKLWIAVASINDNTTSRVVGLINQTADKLTSVYEDLEGNVSSLEQTVKGISTTVQNDIKKEISTINQTAEEIMMGVYDPDSSSSLGLLLDGITSNTTKTNVVKVKSVNAAPPEGDKYEEQPRWIGEKFEPVGKQSATGRYYFDPNGKTPYTYFCYVVDDEHYEVYGINNFAMASLNSRVSENEVEIENLALFKSETEKNMTSITQTVDENTAKIASVAAGEYVMCTNINLKISEEDKAVFTTKRYLNAPTWDDGKFVFGDDEDENGSYCMLQGDDTCYYRLFFDNEGEITGYERYELALKGLATISQKVTENQSSIGMVVENNNVKANIIVKAINNSESEISINANKINFDGFTTFANTSDLEDVKNNLESVESKAISKVEVQYALSDSTVTPPETGWNIIAPNWESGKYMWQKTVITYADNTVENGAVTCIQGAKGADGTGVSIKSTAYTKETVSDDAVGQLFEIYSDSECSVQITGAASGDAYLVHGYLFVYNGTDNKFVCTGKIQGPAGQDGKNGTDGINGSNASLVSITPSALFFKSTEGKDGQFTPNTIYLYPRFQTVTYNKWQYSIDGGTNWNDVVHGEDNLWIGKFNSIPNVLAINVGCSLYTDLITSISFKCLSSDNTVYDIVSISKIYDVVDLQIGARNLVFDSNRAVTNSGYYVETYNMSEDWVREEVYTISIKGTVNDGQYFRIWANGPTTPLTTVIYDKSRDIHVVTFKTPSIIETRNEKTLLVYNYPRETATQASIEWVKLEKGNKATDWSPAPEDLIESAANVNVMLSNEAHFFEADSNGIPTETEIILDVVGYKGSIQSETSVGAIEGLPSAGMTATIINNKTTNTQVSIEVTNKLTSEISDSGTLKIPITVNGHTINKFFSWSKSKAGYTPQKGVDYFDGTKGDNGTSIVWKGSFETPPDGANNGWSYYNSKDKASYVYQDGTWYQMSIDGVDGIGINTITTTYGVSTSATVKPTNWGNNIPSVAQGSYLWTRTITDYTDPFKADTVTYTYSRQGEDGETGKAGTSVTIKSIQYQEGSFPNSVPNKEWSDEVVAVSKGKYLWSKTTFSDGSVAYGVSRQGDDGISITWKGESSYAPENPEKNWVYKDTDDGIVYIYNGNGWEPMVNDGIGGLSVFITYNDSVETPSVPTDDGTSNGWHTDATAASIWMSQKVAEDINSGTWGEPIKIKGTDGIGIAKVRPQYYLANFNVAEGNIFLDGNWNYYEPKWEKDKYIWTRSEITWENEEITYTEPVLADALNSANENADSAKDTANDAKDVANEALGKATGVETTIGKWCYENDTTYIDGGKIYTGSVTANKLFGNTLASENYKEGTGVFSEAGTFFDLADGSIKSQNFAINNEGEATITKGYIGGENKGFTIDASSLYNTQTLLKGNKDEISNIGVYLGTDGIGLGNGNFYVDNLGDLVTYGSVVMYGSDGQRAIELEDGHLTLSGNITLGGNITWDMKNSPVVSAYSGTGTGNPSTDPSFWESIFDPTRHLYMALSFDGGTTWNIPTKIVGDKGDQGEQGIQGDPGPSGIINDEDIFNALTNNGANQGIYSYPFVVGDEDEGEIKTQIYINAQYIKSKSITADKIVSYGIAEVADTIYIGDLYAGGNKTIWFADRANITVHDGTVPNMSISAHTITLGDNINFSSGSIVDFSNATVRGITIQAVFA